MDSGKTPIIKNIESAIHLYNLLQRGQIPITKNITVVDEKGNEYEATYPKRAKGLVKNGRARFIDENTICLACPPNQILEDNKVKNNNTELNMEYVLSRIDQILEEKEYIKEAIDSINNMKLNTSPEGGRGDMARAAAISAAIQARETTNQDILKMLNKMYDNLNPPKENNSTVDKKIKLAEDLIKTAIEYEITNLPEVTESITSMMDKI